MNKCKYKDFCNVAAASGNCIHCKSHDYDQCNLYQQWDENTEGNTCPYKDRCSSFHYPFGCSYSDMIEACPDYEDFNTPKVTSNQYSDQASLYVAPPKKQRKRRKRDDELTPEELAERNKRREEYKRRRELQEIEDRKSRKNNLILLIALFAISLSLIIIGLIFR